MAEKEYAPKKMLTLHILDILKRFSDEEHRLSQKQIQDILADENEKYRMSVDRKAIKRNLEELIKAGYDIRSEERTRGTGKKANTIAKGATVTWMWTTSQVFRTAGSRMLWGMRMLLRCVMPARL